MTRRPTSSRLARLTELGRNLRSALRGLFSQEFSYSTGYLAVILNGCLFAPSLLTFWFVNGLIDFSTAVAIGAVATPASLQIRLLAYVLVVPVFLLARVVAHLLHPAHRAQVLAGSCPSSTLMSLDWFSVGILATGLPLALQNFGPWVGMNVVFLAGVFLLPRFVPGRYAGRLRLLAILTGGAVFLYATYGDAVALLPHPGTVLGPVATVTLSDATTQWLYRLVNSLTLGPLVVALFGMVTNRILTRPELASIPVVRHALPHRDLDVVVATSAAFGTLFYLLVVAAASGTFVLVP